MTTDSDRPNPWVDPVYDQSTPRPPLPSEPDLAALERLAKRAQNVHPDNWSYWLGMVLSSSAERTMLQALSPDVVLGLVAALRAALAAATPEPATEPKKGNDSTGHRHIDGYCVEPGCDVHVRYPRATPTAPALDVQPCQYCGSVNGETPVGVFHPDPMTGETLRAAINAACDLTNPRLSEVDWDQVAAVFDAPIRLPHESPCKFRSGDGWYVCVVHGWSGPPSQRSRVLVCPAALSPAPTTEDEPR